MIPDYSKYNPDGIQKPKPIFFQPRRILTVHGNLIPEIKNLKPSKKIIFPFLGAILIIVLIMHSLSYVSSARNSQGEILGAATTAYSDLSSAGDSLKDQNFA